MEIGSGPRYSMVVLVMALIAAGTISILPDGIVVTDLI